MFPLETTDQMHTTIRLESAPKRIVSLVPSQTEFLADLGLVNELVGVTKFCIYPKGLLTPQRNIGGTKNLKLEKIAALNPDIIIGNKEENSKDEIAWLKKRFPVWMSDIITLEDTYEMMLKIGELTNKSTAATSIVQAIKQNFTTFNIDCQDAILHQKIVYLIWYKPMMAAGPNTFIHHIIEKLGWENLITEERYPVLSEEQLLQLNPDVLLLSSEPFPFREKHLNYFKGILPNIEIKLVDGEFFSWYGSRLIQAPYYFQSLL